MPTRPEDRARQNIDRMLEESGWVVQDRSHFNLSAGRGVAICELSVKIEGMEQVELWESVMKGNKI